MVKQTVLDVGVSTTSYDQLVTCCAAWIAEHRAQKGGPLARYLCFLSVHGLITARDNPEVRRILNAADVVAPDGMPVVWALRSFGFRNQARVYGPTAMHRICESAQTLGHRIFLYGGTDRSLAELCRRLAERFPALNIVGAFAPPFRPLTADEDRTVVALIRESAADLVFVGISTPKQERWMDQHRESLPGVILAGVGAAFDFHAGRVRQAPAWMQRHGLEWMFRLAMEPARLWKRYLLVTPRFLPLWAVQWASSKLSGASFSLRGTLVPLVRWRTETEEVVAKFRKMPKHRALAVSALQSRVETIAPTEPRPRGSGAFRWRTEVRRRLKSAPQER